jgi:hypothetical protein
MIARRKRVADCSFSLEGKMASGFDKKADDWNIAAHVMLRKTPESLSGVAFKFGSPSIRVAAQVSLLGRISGSNIPTSEDYARFVAVSLRNFTSKPFSIHDLQGLRGNVELTAESMFPIALQKGSTLLFFNAEIDMTGDPHQFVISGQWIIRKVLNYSQTWT